MKKILAKITDEEKELWISINALKSTYRTLLQITDYPINQDDVTTRLKECESKLRDFWDQITDRYGVPIYLDKPMYVDVEHNCIYVTL